jgi:hypothetical protein
LVVEQVVDSVGVEQFLVQMLEALVIVVDTVVLLPVFHNNFMVLTLAAQTVVEIMVAVQEWVVQAEHAQQVLE